MRTVELSNHPSEMLRAVHAESAAAEEQARRRYENALRSHRKRLGTMRNKRDQARLRRRWLDWLRAAFAVWRERRKAPRPPIPVVYNSDRVEALTAGMNGEQLAVRAFGRVLGDDWTLLRGYRNRRGEIDNLLLGPGGLLAVEVKYRNATVHCDGDDWWYDKYDQYGNLVERDQPLTDRRGRSPSRQLNEPADELEGFLRSRGERISIGRVILFNHPRSRLGDNDNLTVEVATSADWIADRLLKNSRPFLDAAHLTRLEQLIVRDHNFHGSRRRGR